MADPLIIAGLIWVGGIVFFAALDWAFSDGASPGLSLIWPLVLIVVLVIVIDNLVRRTPGA